MQRKNQAEWIESRKRWQINVQADGERRTFVSTKKNSHPDNVKGKIEAEKKADKWLEQRLIDENTRVETLLDRWTEKLEISTSYSHFHQYEKYIKHYIKPAIGAKRISRINQNDLQVIIDSAYAHPYSATHPRKKKDGTPYAPPKTGNTKLSEKTLRNIRGCILAFIKYCRTTRVASLFPESLTIPASASRSEKTIATPNDIKTLFASSMTTWRGRPKEDRFIHAYRFCVLTGMRPGELIALQNMNIDDKKVRITQSINERGEITQGKNKNARRTYMLDDHALKVLEDQRRMLINLGQISPFVFPAADRGYISQQLFRDSWKRYCGANNINGANTPYELRHTFVSINDEMPEALKKMIVGHSKSMDTDGVYGHEKAGDMEKAAQYVSAAFSKILGW